MSDETRVAPAPVSDPVPAPEPVPTADAPVPTGSSGPRRASGMLGQVVGIVGMVVCLALVVGVLFGRGWATGAVDDVAGNLDAAVGRAVPLLDRAGAGIGEVAGKAAGVAAAAEAIAIDPNATPEALQGVLDRLGAVSQRYLELRGAYAGAREQVVSALDQLAFIDRFVPGISVPQGPIDALGALDAAAQGLDTRVMDLIGAGAAVQAIDATAAAIADKARAVEDGLGTVTVGINDVKARLAGLRDQIAEINGTVNTLVTVVAVVLVVVLLYLTLLHFVLFRFSRRYARDVTAA